MSSEPKFYGKYRGTCTNNIDPQNMGRIRGICPTVTGVNETPWAMPCTPYAGMMEGLFLIPPIGANIWFEFEQGDPSLPIYSGCYWSIGQTPATPALPSTKMLKTKFYELKFDDIPGKGGITIQTVTGQKISLDSKGFIEITNGMATIRVMGPTVSINNGALDVT